MELLLSSKTFLSKHMCTTYILRCSDGTFYTGYTVDLDNRIKKHNSGKGAKYTRGRTPVSVVFSIDFDNKSKAMKFEATIKKKTRKQKLELIEQNRITI